MLTARVLFVYGSGGAGHYASALALRDALLRHETRARFGDVQLRIELVDGSQLAGATNADRVYNAAVMSGLPGLTSILYWLARTMQPLSQRVLARQMKSSIDNLQVTGGVVHLVVSFVPFLNPALLYALPHIPYLTVITDFEHSEEHPWLQDQRQICFCPTREVARQARQLGWPDTHVQETSGMLVRGEFYEAAAALASDRATESRTGKGNNKLIVVLFGGLPPTGLVFRIVQAVIDRKCNCTLAVVCAKNRRLKQLLESSFGVKPSAGPTTLELHGYLDTEQLAGLMARAEAIIAKPGPGVTAEADVLCVPVLFPLFGFRVMAQEQPVLRRALEQSKGISCRSIDHLVDIIESPDQLDTMRRSIVRANNVVAGTAQDPTGPNRSLYEIVDFLVRHVPRTVTANPYVDSTVSW
ncbi:putative monogalactosyldiacylglycerol synthase 2, chloroplastic [Porphyridium purpureum]|uniref:Putative monogalactosyldiacylglycerol synthase 2, chloroplastic n=1 Tax=Porphyridium purpureum TaxID=35688 RepID=A0A5J4Z8T0_PORPP|nr:putative monogalactosyldiacylglycerol synthase 2, chloroplastic [Porphyridium purpureum]|eukprot:POR7326..scf295_1